MEILDLPGRGRGAVATKDFCRGAIVLVTPLWAVFPKDSKREDLLTSAQKEAKSYQRLCGASDFLKLKFNSFTMYEIDQGRRKITGSCLIPEASFFNHSCDYNVGRIQIDSAMIFFARRNISSGAELTIAYSTWIYPSAILEEADILKEARQEFLKEAFDFD
jgi:hypothetical protein